MEQISNDPTYADNFDGASVIELDDGMMIRRVIARKLICDMCHNERIGGSECPNDPDYIKNIKAGNKLVPCRSKEKAAYIIREF